MKIFQINHDLFGSLHSQGTKYHKQANNKSQQDNVSFSGLTKKMKKRTYIDGQRDIKPILDARNDKSTIVGQLPKFILEKLPRENRKEAIMDIYDTFDKIALELREFDVNDPTNKISEIMKGRPESSVELFKGILDKYKITKPWDDIDIIYLGKGGKGAAYKLEGLKDTSGNNEDEFVIKVFHVIEGENWQYSKSHGCYAELNSAAYWMNNAGEDTNRGKFFFGNMRTGYMINKYVDEDVRLPKRTINPYSYGLKCTDENAATKHNVCKGYSYDWGGVRVVNRLKNGDKYARKILEDIKNTPESKRMKTWLELYCKSDANFESKNAGLAMAVKHIPDSYKNICIDLCLKLNENKANQGLAYALKYIPYKDAVKYYEKLVKRGDDVTQIILFNEIPLLAMKHRDENVKDDLQSRRSEILPTRVAKYYEISEKYARPKTIEHLASYTHLLPKDKYKDCFERLAKIDNYDLHDRMIYKFSAIEEKDKYWAACMLAENIKDKKLKKRLLSSITFLPPEQYSYVENLLNKKK